MPSSVTQILGSALAQVAQTPNTQGAVHGTAQATRLAQAVAGEKGAPVNAIKSDEKRAVRTRRPQVEGSFAKQASKQTEAKPAQKKGAEEEDADEETSSEKKGLDVMA